MHTLDQIVKSLHDKIEFITGLRFPLEADLNAQCDSIKVHLTTAIQETKTKTKNKYLLQCLKDNTYGDYRSIEYDLANEEFIQFYPRNYSEIEKDFWCEFGAPLSFRAFLTQKGHWIENCIRETCSFYYKLLQNVEQYVGSEDLSNIRRYIFNIIEFNDRAYDPGKIMNKEKSITPFYRGYGGKITFPSLHVVTYLISDRRIIRIEFDAGSYIKSVEQIIQKDIKTILTVHESTLHIYYHGIANSDEIVLDN